MNGTVKTFLITGAVVAWGAVHLVSLVENFDVPSSFDSAFATLVGAVMVSPRKQDKTPKD